MLKNVLWLKIFKKYKLSITQITVLKGQKRENEEILNIDW